MKHIERNATEASIIIGDFNIPKANWALSSCDGDNIGKLFIKFVITSGHYHFVSFHTRDENILDLILTNDEQGISSVEARRPLGHSDQCVVDFIILK